MLKEMECVIVLVVFSLLTSYQRASAIDDHYVAAVVETAPGTSLETWDNYIGFIAQAATLGTDIIIFPENSVYTSTSDFITVPFNGLLKRKAVPALSFGDYDVRLVRMSDAARSYSMYVVVNLHELLDCTRNDTGELCPEKRQYIFNTNVVFDRNGAIIHRYRKNHLFGEPGITPAFERGIGFFETDFGVTFAILICFDILNQVPWQASARSVKNLVANVNWISEMPFVSAIQAHEAIAYGMDANLMVAGANNVSDGASGSGIYSGKSGALVSFITGVPASPLLVAKVPKVPGYALKTLGPIRQNPEVMNGLKTLVDPSLPFHNTRVLAPGYQEFTLAYKDVTCRFRIKIRESRCRKKYIYRAGAFSGNRSIIGHLAHGFRDCAVFSCTGATIDTCGQKFTPYTEDATAEFDELFIEGTVPTDVEDPESHFPSSTFYPVSLDIGLLPLEPASFHYSVVARDDVTVHSLTLKNLGAQLYTFALWGRKFDWDCSEDKEP